jgi:hypothetical protein
VATEVAAHAGTSIGITHRTVVAAFTDRASAAEYIAATRA